MIFTHGLWGFVLTITIEHTNMKPQKLKKTTPGQGATKAAITSGRGRHDAARQLSEGDESEYDEPSPVQESEPGRKKPRQTKRCGFYVPNNDFLC